MTDKEIEICKAQIIRLCREDPKNYKLFLAFFKALDSGADRRTAFVKAAMAYGHDEITAAQEADAFIAEEAAAGA